MKKFMVFIIGMIMTFGLAACSTEQNVDTTDTLVTSIESVASDSLESTDQVDSTTEYEVEAPGEETASTSQDSTASSDETAGEGRTLVVYYSASGRTEAVAEYIAGATNADTFELVPVEPYSDDDLDWTDRDSRVSQEYADPDIRAVALNASTVENWEEYDTVFIGYPIWWGIAAWPVDEFISANDFTGKTVIPFCTSSSSGLGESGELLAEAAGTGNWLTGERFRSGASEDTVLSWLEGLDL